jgi:pimeloyl-ACP methyl ester carboxylesterase
MFTASTPPALTADAARADELLVVAPLEGVRALHNSKNPLSDARTLGAKANMTDEIAPTHEDRTFDERAFWSAFRHQVASGLDDVRIHAVVGGDGPAIVLLHGFPQSWREWRLIMLPLLRRGYTIVAPDLRGFGESDRPLSGYDVGTVSDDVRNMVRQIGHPRVSLVGHDLGASVAYAWAAAHPDEVERLVLMEAFPAGLEPRMATAPLLRGKPLWHLGFLGTADVPEALLAGRERVFLSYLFRTGAHDPLSFSNEDIDTYVESLAAPGGVRTAAAHVRAMAASAQINRKLSERRLTMPVLAIGGAISFGSRMADAARLFADDVTAAVADRCGHWIPEERPTWLSQQLTTFLSGTRPSTAATAVAPASS